MLLFPYVGPGDVDDVIQNLDGIYVYPVNIQITNTCCQKIKSVYKHKY